MRPPTLLDTCKDGHPIVTGPGGHRHCPTCQGNRRRERRAAGKQGALLMNRIYTAGWSAHSGIDADTGRPIVRILLDGAVAKILPGDVIESEIDDAVHEAMVAHHA